MRLRISVVLVLLLVAFGCHQAREWNEPPSVGFSFTPQSPSVGTTVEFTAEATDPEDGTVVSFEWTFGDGGEASGPTVTHEYGAAGSYDVTVTVTDDGGRTDSATKTVAVQE